MTLEKRGRIVRDSAYMVPQLANYHASNQLTTSWQYGVGEDVLGYTQATAYVHIVLGAADWIEFQFVYSFDGVAWIPREGDSATRVVADFSRRLSIPVLDPHFNIQVRGGGTLTTSVLVCDVVFGDASFADDLGGISAAGGTEPVTDIPAFTMNSNADDESDPFPIRGDGLLRAEITLPDTTSADGEFYFETASASDGTFYQEPTPVLSKVAGTGLSHVPLVFDKPGSKWARLAYVRTSGGAASEITASITAW